LKDARYSSKTIIIQDPIIIDIESDSENSEDERIRKEKEKEEQTRKAEVQEQKKRNRIRNKRLRLASAAKIAKRSDRYECSDCVGLVFDSSLELFLHLRNAHTFNKISHVKKYDVRSAQSLINCGHNRQVNDMSVISAFRAKLIKLIKRNASYDFNFQVSG